MNNYNYSYFSTACMAVTAKSVPPKTGPGRTNFGSKNGPPGLVLIAKIGPTLPKTVHQSFSSTDKLTWAL